MGEFIASGFWKAVLVAVIVSGVTAPIGGVVLSKKNKIFGEIVRWVPTIIVYLYIWQIRHGVGWLIFGILAILGFINTIIQALFKKMPDEMFEGFVEGLFDQTKLPTLVSTELRLDSITALSGKKVLYTYTLLNVDTGQIFSSEIISSLRDNLINDGINDKSLTLLREQNATFVFKYMDKEQKGQVGIFEITPNDYRKS
jgi:hypothetical protein